MATSFQPFTGLHWNFQGMYLIMISCGLFLYFLELLLNCWIYWAEIFRASAPKLLIILIFIHFMDYLQSSYQDVRTKLSCINWVPTCIKKGGTKEGCWGKRESPPPRFQNYFLIPFFPPWQFMVILPSLEKLQSCLYFLIHQLYFYSPVLLNLLHCPFLYSGLYIISFIVFKTTCFNMCLVFIYISTIRVS